MGSELLDNTRRFIPAQTLAVRAQVRAHRERIARENSSESAPPSTSGKSSLRSLLGREPDSKLYGTASASSVAATRTKGDVDANGSSSPSAVKKARSASHGNGKFDRQAKARAAAMRRFSATAGVFPDTAECRGIKIDFKQGAAVICGKQVSLSTHRLDLLLAVLENSNLELSHEAYLSRKQMRFPSGLNSRSYNARDFFYNMYALKDELQKQLGISEDIPILVRPGEGKFLTINYAIRPQLGLK